jgi:hypothetical protein
MPAGTLVGELQRLASKGQTIGVDRPRRRMLISRLHPPTRLVRPAPPMLLVRGFANGYKIVFNWAPTVEVSCSRAPSVDQVRRIRRC